MSGFASIPGCPSDAALAMNACEGRDCCGALRRYWLFSLYTDTNQSTPTPVKNSPRPPIR